MPNTINISNVLKQVRTLAENDQLPLEVVFQQCYDNEHLSPENNYGAWDQCLVEVYNTRDPKPTIEEFGDAMYSIWKDAGLSREIMIKALKSIPAYQGTPVYTEVNKFYPITILMTIDTVNTVRTGRLSIIITDDNGDPNQGSNEITVTAKVNTTLVWKGVSKNGTDTVQLKQFIRESNISLFPDNEPNAQPDGTFKGTLNKKGFETYSFSITINGGGRVYRWDPYICAV